MQSNEGGISMNQNTIRLLGFVDDLDIIGEPLADSDTDYGAKVLEEAGRK